MVCYIKLKYCIFFIGLSLYDWNIALEIPKLKHFYFWRLKNLWSELSKIHNININVFNNLHFTLLKPTFCRIIFQDINIFLTSSFLSASEEAFRNCHRQRLALHCLSNMWRILIYSDLHVKCHVYGSKLATLL